MLLKALHGRLVQMPVNRESGNDLHAIHSSSLMGHQPPSSMWR